MGRGWDGGGGNPVLLIEVAVVVSVALLEEPAHEFLSGDSTFGTTAPRMYHHTFTSHPLFGHKWVDQKRTQAGCVHTRSH